ncbi:MAG: hypothetical protein JNM69_12395 [Archangium sp.]|nr:hypothetical protein [Archangium sp.]
MRQLLLAVVAMVLGVCAATSCGPVKLTGPTALVLEVYFSEARGAKALVISGSAEVDGVPVNVFPTSQRPEQLTGAAFPVPQTVRILLNDSRAGIPLQLTVIGINADGDPVEAATQTVTPIAQAETLVTITLKPFTDAIDADGGTGASDAGMTTFDAGTPDAGVRCTCTTGCCDSSGRCASPISLLLGSRNMLSVVLSGRTGEFCNGLCPPGKTSQFVNGTCQCGTAASCGDGVRCQGQGTNGRCVCDTSSGCRGCCSSNTACDTGRTLQCGNAGNQCSRCEGVTNVCQLTGRCSVNMCPPPSSANQNQCCSGSAPVTAQFPTCTSATGDCVACDLLRSSACRPVAVGSAGQPCACGASAQCANNQLCLIQNGVPTCVTVN